MRNVPVLLHYYNVKGTVPVYMSLGFAAHILFMRCKKDDTGKFSGVWNGTSYTINDDHAMIYAERWSKMNEETMVRETLKDSFLWGHDLSALPGFEASVTMHLKLIMQNGIRSALKKIVL